MSSLFCMLPYLNKKYNSKSINVLFYSGQIVLRSDHGAPDSWETIKNWMDPAIPVVNASPPPNPTFSIKNPEVAELTAYDPLPYLFGTIFQPTQKNQHHPQKLML